MAVVLVLVVFGFENVEHVFVSETTPYRVPDGEWVPSVSGRNAEVWATGDADSATDQGVATLIERADPDRVLYVGDVYPNGTSDQFADWERVWGGLVTRMAPTPGNHDWPEAAEGYDPFWSGARGTPPPTHYAFRAGGWQLLSLNSEHEEQTAQIEWVRERTASSGGCTIAFWHRPRWSAGPHGDDSAVAGLWQAARGRVAAVISGHEHNMQRLAPDGGTRQFISGAGGSSHTVPDQADPRLEFGDGTHYGALRLRLTSGVARWAFVSTSSDVLDAGTFRCRAGLDY
jgi:calcineurin-like phosphoesterase family protein